jgi:hypothetical protein
MYWMTIRLYDGKMGRWEDGKTGRREDSVELNFEF